MNDTVSGIGFGLLIIGLFLAGHYVAVWLMRRRRCLCYLVTLTTDDVEWLQAEGGVLWAIYRRCPKHGKRAKLPLYTADLGWLDEDRTAVDRTAVAVGN
jgi:hypothetical protein